MKEVYELDVYNLAEELADKVWNDFDRWPLKVQKTIGYQIIRAADSISANLAEGYGRFTPAEHKLFYRYAKRLLRGDQSLAEKVDPPWNNHRRSTSIQIYN